MFKMILVAVLILSSVIPSIARAGDMALYVKSGVLNWEENSNAGNNKRIGAVQEGGLKYVKTDSDGVGYEQSVGLWHALTYHDGINPETGDQAKDITSDLGLKTYTGISIPVPICECLSVGTIAGIGTNTFLHMPNDFWFVLNSKNGLIVNFEELEVRAGVLYPLYSNNIINYSGVQGLVSVQPKGELSPFVELTVTLSKNWKLGAYYETWKWAKSGAVPFTYTGKNLSSPLSKGTTLSQPATTVINSGLNLEYRF